MNNIGFDADPFAKTNADDEERLRMYFIEPPFYNAVYGNPDEADSKIVFAPRGSGKTALKKMIENKSQEDNLLCISYNNFDIGKLKLQEIDMDYHLINIIRLIVVALITSIEEKGLSKLSETDRHYLYLFVKNYLSDIEQIELESSIDSVKNFSDKAKEWWNKFLGPIGIVINVLLTRIGIDKVEIEKFDRQGGSLGRPQYQLQILQRLSSKIGHNSIYVLIDRVDEYSFTGNATNSYKFIKDLLTNLNILEIKGIGFKFFLWDLILEDYQIEARPDRIKYYNLSWKKNQLKSMLSERLKAYSDKKIKSLEDICEFEVNNNSGLGIDDIIILLSQGSPRNIIRICKEILDQQSEINYSHNKITKEAFVKGIEVFSKNYTHESIDERVINDLIKVNRLDFTVRYIYNDVFKFTQQAGISKVKIWQDSGIIEKIGTIQDTIGAKPSNLYIIKSLLVGKYIFSNLDIFEFIETKTYKCKQCGEMLFRDWDINNKSICSNCQVDVEKYKSQISFFD
ncbi:P-loop ATPase, Sll1717 family [Clostridium formicaceticum]|nr:hypothetical protein [Clostridium formicaceticum]